MRERLLIKTMFLEGEILLIIYFLVQNLFDNVFECDNANVDPFVLNNG